MATQFEKLWKGLGMKNRTLSDEEIDNFIEMIEKASKGQKTTEQLDRLEKLQKKMEEALGAYNPKTEDTKIEEDERSILMEEGDTMNKRIHNHRCKNNLYREDPEGCPCCGEDDDSLVFDYDNDEWNCLECGWKFQTQPLDEESDDYKDVVDNN